MRGHVVSVTFPAAVGQGKASISPSDPEVEAVLRTIDEALVSRGFVRDVSPAEASVQGFIASYSRRNSEGLIELGDCPIVWLRGDRLEITFSEGRAPNYVAKNPTVDALKKILSRHYGSKRVTVKRVPG